LSTSQRNAKSARLYKTALTYGLLSAFCGVFSVVYLQFSHGESSPFLIWLFVPPLLLGAIPALLFSRAQTGKLPNAPVRRLWNSAVATLTAGMLVRAVINISGRYTEYDTIYWILSGLLFLLAAALYIQRLVKAAACGREAV
jgi:hypothetical protein